MITQKFSIWHVDDYPFAKHKYINISAKTLLQLGSKGKLSLWGEIHMRLLHRITEGNQERMC